MGCESSRFDSSNEELALKLGEGKLKYSNYRIKSMSKILSSVSAQGMISKESFKDIAYNFSLPCASKVKNSEFYSLLQVKGAYNLKILTTLAVLLCKGSINDKASVLFKLWAKSEKSMTEEEFSQMLDCLFDLVLEKLPILKKEPEKGLLNNEDFENYLNTARKGREITKKSLLNELFSSENLEKDFFILWLNKGDNSNWMIPGQIRQNLIHYGRNVQKFNFSNFERVKNYPANKTRDSFNQSTDSSKEITVSTE